MQQSIYDLYTIGAACSTWNGHLEGKEGQQLAWATEDELERYKMPPADLPLIPAITQAMRAKQSNM